MWVNVGESRYTGVLFCKGSCLGVDFANVDEGTVVHLVSAPV